MPKPILLVACVFLVTVLAVSPAAGLQGGTLCTISVQQGVNQRSGPGTSYGVVSTLDAGQDVWADSQALDTAGRIWWHLTAGAWVSADAVIETGQCDDLPTWPDMTGPTATRPRLPTESPAVASPIPGNPEPIAGAPFQAGDEVTVTDENPYLLLYSEPDKTATVLEAIIGGVTLVITGGPQEVGDTVWWEVRSQSGQTGWIPGAIGGRPTLLPAAGNAVTAYNGPFAIGDDVTVMGRDGILFLHSEPGADAAIIEAAISGIVLTLVDGPQIIDGVPWWKVLSVSRSEGWVAESIDGQATIALPGELTDAAASVTELPSPDGQAYQIIVAADQPRTLTGIMLTQGEVFSIRYLGGSWRAGPLPTWPAVGADGDPQVASKSSFPVPTMPVMTLVGGIGQWVFAAPGQMTLESPTTGVLWLGANDDIYTDNEGTLTVVVTTGQSRASLTAVVTASRLNVRRGPGPEYGAVLELTSGQTITLVGRNADGTWVQLNAEEPRWVSTDYIRLNGDVMSLLATYQEAGGWGLSGQPSGVRAQVLSLLRIRGGPGTRFQQLMDPDTLDVGQVVDIIGKSADGAWYQVNVGNRSGWIAAEYVALSGGAATTVPITSP